MSNPFSLRQVATTSVIALGAKVLMVVIVYGTHLALAWLYGAKLMGTFFIASNLILLLGMACTLGLDKGMLRFAAMLQDEGRESLIGRLSWQSSALILVLSALLAVSLYLGKTGLSVYLNASDLPAMLPLFLLALPIYAVSFMLRETLRGLGSVLWATLIQYVVQPGVLLALIVVLFFLKPLSEDQPLLLALAFLSSMLLTLAVVLWRLKVQNLDGPKEKGDSQLWKDLYKYSWPLFLITLLQNATLVADSLILAFFRPPQEVAYYGSAVKLSTFVTLPLLAINSVVPPLFVKFYQRQQMVELERLARTTARWIYYLSLPLCLLLVLLSSELLGFFGPGFQTARWGLIFMALGQIINALTGSVFILLFMTENQQQALSLRTLSVVLALPLMVWLAFKYGTNGMALARSLGGAVPNLVAVWLAWKIMGIKTFAEDVILITVASLVALGLSWGIAFQWQAIWGAVAFSLIYLVMLGGAIWHRKEWRLLQTIAAK